MRCYTDKRGSLTPAKRTQRVRAAGQNKANPHIETAPGPPRPNEPNALLQTDKTKPMCAALPRPNEPNPFVQPAKQSQSAQTNLRRASATERTQRGFDQRRSAKYKISAIATTASTASTTTSPM
jgi:hypothetical protein